MSEAFSIATLLVDPLVPLREDNFFETKKILTVISLSINILNCHVTSANSIIFGNDNILIRFVLQFQLCHRIEHIFHSP